MNNYLVSVGVPVYNAEKYIERCVKSILSQSYENLEVVFVDDCSTDNSVSIIENTLKFYPHRKEQVRIIRHTSNQGVSIARNTFLDNHTGDFIMFVDSDDYLMPNAVSRLVSRQNIDDCDMVSGAYTKDLGETKELHDENCGLEVDELLQRCCCTQRCHENVARLFRAKLFNAPSVRYLPDVKIGEDWIFMVEVLLRMHHIDSINDVVYVYDFTNNTSAMHQITMDKSKYFLADLNALSHIKQLVIHKKDIVNGVEKLMATIIENGLMLAYVNHNRTLFRNLKHYICRISNSNIKKDYYFKKVKIGSYISLESYSLYFEIRKIYHTIKNAFVRR